MEANQARPQNMIDTTDALEAVSACQSMKNFLFTLIIIGLVLCQIIFWMDHFGLINEEGCSPCQGDVQKTPSATCPKDPCSDVLEPQTKGFVFLAATTDTAPQAEPATAESEQAKSIEQTVDEIVKRASQENPDMEVLPKEEGEQATSTQEQSGQAASSGDVMARFRVSCWLAGGLVAICNFVVLTAAILYCLSLLMCLKISLAGRLGGINHIARAFFISLFLLVVITPWQVVLPKVLIGATWLPGELLCGNWDKADSSIFWKVMLYLRFCGLCLVTFWLLLWAQLRSAKWARATLRRLGVAR